MPGRSRLGWPLTRLQAIFIFVDEVLPPTAALMSVIYEEHKDEDGFLYITYSGENVRLYLAPIWHSIDLRKTFGFQEL